MRFASVTISFKSSMLPHSGTTINSCVDEGRRYRVSVFNCSAICSSMPEYRITIAPFIPAVLVSTYIFTLFLSSSEPGTILTNSSDSNCLPSIFSITDTRDLICKKAVFIKLVHSLKGYNYTRIHIRQTKEHPASNRYGFRKLTIDSKKLNDYLSNTDNTSMEHNDLKNELQLITEHYKDLLGSAIPEPPFVPITYNLS